MYVKITLKFCTFYGGQAQQLFQKDAQIITPKALESVKAALASSEIENKAAIKKKAILRKAAGQSWEDPTLADWPESMISLSLQFSFIFGFSFWDVDWNINERTLLVYIMPEGVSFPFF